MKNKILFISLAVVLALSVGLIGCTEEAPEEYIRLGHIVPFTGWLSFVGQEWENSTELALDHINDAGGVLGKTLKVLYEDSGTTGPGHVDAMEKLITVHDVQAIVGGTSTGETLASYEKAKLNKVVFISPSATSAEISGIHHGGYFFRLCPSDLLQGTAMAKLAYELKGYRTANIISRDDAYGRGLGEVFKDTFEALGGEVKKEVIYDPAAPDYSGYVSAVLDPPDVDVIVVNPLMEDAVRLFKKFDLAGAIPNYGWIVCEGAQAPDIPEEVGVDVMEGIGGATPYPEGTGPYAAAYFAEYGEHYFAYGPNVYDAFVLLALAIEHAGEYDGEAIAASIREVANPPGEPVSDVATALELVRDGVDIDYQGAGGEIIFDEYGDVWTSLARVWEYQDGEIVYVGDIEVE